MAVSILSEKERDLMRSAGKSAAATLAAVTSRIRPGITTLDIDNWVRTDTRQRGGKPAQLGYKGFPAAVCTSRNHVVCHGIPRADERVEEGDIINVDVTTNLNGYHGDTSLTLMVGQVSPEARHITDAARLCRDAGIRAVRPGLRLGELGAIIEDVARGLGCSIVRELGGHGIGQFMHQEPHIAHHGYRGGLRLRAGMAITIEPMVNLGSAEVDVLDDDWTVVTRDGKWSAQFEHTVLVTDDGHEILTLC